MPLYQGIIGGGSSPVEPVDLSPVLLWTNPSPNEVFAPQTVELDLTNYEGVLVELGRNNDRTTLASRVYIKKSDAQTLGGGNTSQYAESNEGYGTARDIRIVSNGVEFGTVKAGTNVAETAMVPFKIYGVKEYVVESDGYTYLGFVKSVDMKALYPTKYENLSIDDFLIPNYESATSAIQNLSGGSPWSASINVNKSYDNSTGILNVSLLLSGRGSDFSTGAHETSNSKNLNVDVFVKTSKIK